MSWSNEQNVLKDRFAVEWLRKGDPWLAALAVLGNQDTGKASVCASTWPFDAYVIRKRNELLAEHGEDYFLPSKADLARKVWDEAGKYNAAAADKTRNYRLYAEIMGFVEKPDGKASKGGVVTIKLNDADSKL